MRRLSLNYLSILCLLLISTLYFKIVFTDYILIKYLFPTRMIHIMISIVVNYYYVKIGYQCLEQYLEIDTLSIIRIGKKRFIVLLIKRIILYLSLFILFSLLVDLILFQKFYALGIVLNLVIVIIVNILMILFYNSVRTHYLPISLFLCMMAKYVLCLLHLR